MRRVLPAGRHALRRALTPPSLLRIDAESLRQRLAAFAASGSRARVRGGSAAIDGGGTFSPYACPAPVGWPEPENPVPAAVLVGLTEKPVPGVLLTKRTAHLRAHSGQVSFPGGRIDPGDPHPEAAALREAQEEIGLDPAHAEIIGRLADVVTGTGYRITPVLALLHPGFIAAPSPQEVEAVFALPLSVLLDPLAPTRRSVMFAGKSREFWVWPHPEHDVWGATAAILVQLAAVLGEEEKT